MTNHHTLPLFNLWRNASLKLILISFLFLSCFGCASTSQKINSQPKPISTYDNSYLQLGKRYFEDGFYKRAMHTLLPLACDGVAEAQYAVGYMYYYGYGVAQDTDVGYFWIKRSADQQFQPAEHALQMINADSTAKSSPYSRLRETERKQPSFEEQTRGTVQ